MSHSKLLMTCFFVTCTALHFASCSLLCLTGTDWPQHLCNRPCSPVDPLCCSPLQPDRVEEQERREREQERARASKRVKFPKEEESSESKKERLTERLLATRSRTEPTLRLARRASIPGAAHPQNLLHELLSPMATGLSHPFPRLVLSVAIGLD